jgi:signal transduction histidine kinase
MIDYLRRHLAAKLFLSYILIMLVGLAVIAIAARFTVPLAFNRHMGPGPGGGPGMMQGAGPGGGMMSDLFINFQASFNEVLLVAFLAAGVVAIVISILLSRGVVAPVKVLTTASQRIAAGHYSDRVQNAGQDELGQLAQSFNEMAKNLEQVESRRRQLIGDVSHELRTPLTAIKGSMEGLIDGVIPATAETYLQIHQEADRLARLVDDLQELSRVEAGAYALQMLPVRLAPIIETTLKRFSIPAREKNITFHLAVPGDLPAVTADEARLAQVLTNLVGNALQYTPPGGEIIIAAIQQGNEVSISVTDTGIGIAAEHLPHLFTRFYRADKSRSRQSGGGSGIGLTIARHLVEAQGGRIWVESEEIGKGSKFTFTLKTSK